MGERASSAVSIVVVRVVLLAIAAGSVVMGAIAVRGRGKDAAAEKGEAVGYICPMHSEATSAIPADCPICGMALEPTGARQGIATTGEPATFQLPAGAAPVRPKDAGWSRLQDSVRDMRALAWAESRDSVVALFYLDEAELLRPGEDAVFTPSVRPAGSPPAVPLRMRREPATGWDAKTALVSFRTLSGSRLLPGQTGSIKLAARVRRNLVVPASAVLQSAIGPYVLLVGPDQTTLRRQSVEIGSTTDRNTALLSGLGEGERVIASRALVFDAERRLGEGVAE